MNYLEHFHCNLRIDNAFTKSLNNKTKIVQIIVVTCVRANTSSKGLHGFLDPRRKRHFVRFLIKDFFQRSLVTATKTRKKQQTESIKKHLQEQKDKKTKERESFLITTIPITVQAAYEPSPAGDDHEEG